MVNIIYQKENTSCDLSNKNNLRRGSDTTDWDKNMGNDHGHHLHSGTLSDATEAIEDGKKTIKRYDPEAILALREDPLSKAKPSCADDRPFWINGKPYVPRMKKPDRVNRIGSGRLGTSDKYQTPSIYTQQYGENNPSTYHNNNNNYYREKTGREFYDSMKQKQNDPNDYKVSFYNPVNRDHRRLLHEKSEENLPEWVNSGPVSRFDMIDLHGFNDDKVSNGNALASKIAETSENKENRDKSGRAFSFDEFLGLDSFMNDQPNSHNFRNQGQSSRFKRYFNNNGNKFRDFGFQYLQNNAPPGFAPIPNFGQQQQFQQKFDSNNNDTANALLDLLHRRGGIDQYKPQQGPGITNMSIMPSAAELESIWRHGNRSDFDRQKLLEHNKAMLAGKSIVDVLDVLTQSQLRANATPFNYQSQQWGPNQYHGMSQCNASQMNQFQMARVLERQMMTQGQNPMYGGLTPQDPEYWDQIRQQQQAFYQQYERNAANRQVKAKFPNNVRRVKFEEKPKLEQFFNHHNMIGDIPTVDPNKALSVEEFERKIKQAAVSGKKQQSNQHN